MKNFLILIFLLIFTGCSIQPHVVKSTDISVPDPQEIYIVSHGWHTGVVVPAETIQQRLPQLKERFGDSPYLEFGWGDKGFYQAEEITFGLTVGAILWPTETVVHAVGLTGKPDVYFANSELEVLCLDGQQYSLLIGFIEQSFFKDGTGNIISRGGGIYGNSQFYEGVGSYHLMNTCNNWTAKGLKSAGLDIQPGSKLTADSVMSYLAGDTSSEFKGPCKKVSGDGIPQSQ